MKFVFKSLLFISLLFAASATMAAGTGMPWEGPLTNLLNSLTGPVARVLGTAAVVAVGVGMAFSEGGSGMRKFLWVVFGLSLAFAAATWALPFLGFGGGLTV